MLYKFNDISATITVHGVNIVVFLICVVKVFSMCHDYFNVSLNVPLTSLAGCLKSKKKKKKNRLLTSNYVLSVLYD